MKKKFHSRNTLSLSVSRFPSTNVVTVVERRLSHTQNTDNDDIFFLHYCGLLLLFVFLVGENLLRLQTKKDSNDRRGSERANIHTHTLLIIVIAAAFFRSSFSQWNTETQHNFYTLIFSSSSCFFVALRFVFRFFSSLLLSGSTQKITADKCRQIHTVKMFDFFFQLFCFYNLNLLFFSKLYYFISKL